MWLAIELLFIIFCIVETKGTFVGFFFLIYENLFEPRQIYCVGRTSEEMAALFEGEEDTVNLITAGGVNGVKSIKKVRGLQYIRYP